MKVMSRVTVCLSDPNVIYKITQSPQFKQYDLFAVHPCGEKILNQICGGSLDCDIVTFDMGERLGVDLKRANFCLPTSRKVCFEISYTQMFSSQSGRTNAIATAQLLVDKTKGRNVIVSSGARTPISLRSPHDVANLCLLFSMSLNQGKEAVFTTANTCVKHAAARRNSNSIAVIVADEKDVKDQTIRRKLMQANAAAALPASDEPVRKRGKVRK